jgi:hypothetical protein
MNLPEFFSWIFVAEGNSGKMGALFPSLCRPKGGAFWQGDNFAACAC